MDKNSRNRFDLSFRSVSSSYLHALTPFFFKFIIPGDKFTFNNRYMVNFEPATGQVMGSFSLHVMQVFVPMWQIWKNFNKFWNKGTGIISPVMSFNPTTNTDDTKLAYYIAPTGSYNADVGINALIHRAYTKSWYDLFAKKYLASLGVIPDPTDWYVDTDDVDTETQDNLLFTPFVSDYYNECTSSIRAGTATSITAPFTLDDVKGAILADNFNNLAIKVGLRAQDFIDSVFGVKGKDNEQVDVVSYYSTKLTSSDTVNLADDQGKVITNTYGVSNNVNSVNEFNKFGVLLGLYWVSCDDFFYAKGMPVELTKAYTSNALSFFHPEAQGLAFDNIKKYNVNDNDTTVSSTYTLAYTEIYNSLRTPYNFALADYCRTAKRANQVPHFQSTNPADDVIDLTYPDNTSFSNLFANSGNHITFNARMQLSAERKVAKVLKHSNIIREFDNAQLL